MKRHNGKSKLYCACRTKAMTCCALCRAEGDVVSAKYLKKCCSFIDIIRSCSGSMPVYIRYILRFKSCLKKRRSHGPYRTGTALCRSCLMIRVRTKSASVYLRNNVRPSFKRVLIFLQYKKCAALSKIYPRTPTVWLAGFRINSL